MESGSNFESSENDEAKVNTGMEDNSKEQRRPKDVAPLTIRTVAPPKASSGPLSIKRERCPSIIDLTGDYDDNNPIKLEQNCSVPPKASLPRSLNRERSAPVIDKDDDNKRIKFEQYMEVWWLGKVPTSQIT